MEYSLPALNADCLMAVTSSSTGEVAGNRLAALQVAVFYLVLRLLTGLLCFFVKPC